MARRDDTSRKESKSVKSPNGREDWNDIFERWLSTDTVVKPVEVPNALPKDFSKLAEADRKQMLDWLGLVSNEEAESHSPDSAEQAAAWLLESRAIMASKRLSIAEKLERLRETRPSASGVRLVKEIVSAAVNGYGRLPISMRVALPATLLAAPMLGGSGVGIAAFGGAIGLPALLIFFLGVSGMTSVVSTLLRTTDEDALFVKGILAILATDMTMMRLNQAAREMAVRDIRPPRQQPMPSSQLEVARRLLSMSALDFEQHVMSLFAESGMVAWVTPAGADAGIDGIAKQAQRLVLVQCKRYAKENTVGRPAIQQFKGVIEENDADLGVFVTTSSFTSQAIESAAKSKRLLLVDMPKLLEWHSSGVALDLEGDAAQEP